MRIIDTLIVFRILKMLTSKWEKMPAYKMGFIDKKGTRIKSKRHPDNPNQWIPNDPSTAEEKGTLTPLTRLVFNLKRIISKVPFGKPKGKLSFGKPKGMISFGEPKGKSHLGSYSTFKCNPFEKEIVSMENCFSETILSFHFHPT